ncbi:MAG: DUF4890 domain-containing protein [Prevotella sp.]|nr:DUF4890 domain-containing protein [Prevotella sp.]
MKKTIFAFIAAITLSTSVMAQNEEGRRPQRQQMDRTEMVKVRTERMVQEYGLNEAQAAKLQELNTSFIDKMPRMGGPRMGGPRGQMGRQRNVDGGTGATVQGDNNERPSREQMEARMKEMRANQEAYDAELKKIMTEEQFAKYQENSQRRMQGGPRGPRGGNRDRSNQ